MRTGKTPKFPARVLRLQNGAIHHTKPTTQEKTMSWKATIIPQSTNNPFTQSRSTQSDLDAMFAQFQELSGEYRTDVHNDGTNAYVLSITVDNHTTELVNLGFSVPSAYRALSVMVETLKLTKLMGGF